MPFEYGDFTLSGCLSQNHSTRLTRQFCSPNPGVHALRFGLFRVRSPLLTESHVSWYSGSCFARSPFVYGAFTLSGWLSQNHSTRLTRQSCSPIPGVHALRFGLFRVRSPLLTESHVVFSSSGYLDVSVPRVPFHSLWIGLWILEVFSSRFPHSEISGSMYICSSPKLFELTRNTAWSLIDTCIAIHALVIVCLL